MSTVMINLPLSGHASMVCKRCGDGTSALIADAAVKCKHGPGGGRRKQRLYLRRNPGMAYRQWLRRIKINRSF